MSVQLTTHTWRETRWLPAVFTTLIALALYSSWNRPLLYDEFVYFVAGGIPSLPEVLGVIHETTTNVNQGVTGAFMFADWALLRVFGAHAWALRLPSLIFAALLFVYAAAFLRQRGLGAVSIALFPMFMVSQELVMRYAGEARTYMPLAAASFGLLAYYSLSSERRSGMGARLMVWSAMLTGVVFHPYIALYWPCLMIFGFLTFYRGTKNLRNLVWFANAPLLASGVSIYVVIAILTWGRGRATAYVDPFNFLPGPVPIEIIAQNLYAWSQPAALTAGVLALGLVAALYVRSHSPVPSAIRNGIQLLRAPFALAALAYLLALIISGTSIVADFWIFPRQWIASSALIALAVFWGAWCVWDAVNQTSRPQGLVAGLALSTAVVIAAAGSVNTQTMALTSWISRAPQVSPDSQALRSYLERGQLLDDSAWMGFAQTNVDSGGPVWPEFAAYYLATDWSTFVLRDGSPE